MTHFEFYDLPIAFHIDPVALKRQFYTLSKKYHPDFYTLASAEEQAKILELSTRNNEAYQILSDFDLRMKYILELKGLLVEEGKNQLPQAFLLEVMELNEALMELEFDFDAHRYQTVLTAIEALDQQLQNQIQPHLDNYQADRTPDEILLKVKEYYLKRRYLLRIRKNLNKFATP